MNRINNFLPVIQNLQQVKSNSILDQLINFSNSEHSRSFYLKAIEELGEQFLYGILSEVKMLSDEGKVNDKAKYLTTLIKKELSNSEKTNKNGKIVKKKSEIENLLELGSKELKNANLGDSSIFMPVPYSTRSIQFPHFLSEAFFTLPSDNRKADVIQTYISIAGKPHKVSMIRGKSDPRDKDRGLLTTEHLRILGALENAWVKQGGKFLTGKDDKSIKICYCEIELRELASILGFKKFGGKDASFLIQKIFDMKSTGYYLQIQGFDGVGFEILGEVLTKNEIKEGKIKTTVKIFFSEAWSRISLERKCVSRNLEMIHISNPIAMKIYMYIYPRLMMNKSFKIELFDLVKNLSLPPAKWHNENRRLKTIFSNIVKHLNGKQINKKTLKCFIYSIKRNHFLDCILK